MARPDNTPKTRLWLMLGVMAAALGLILLAGRLAGGEWLWVILNGLWQHELR